MATQKQSNRRRNSLSRLETQLESGKKPEKLSKVVAAGKVKLYTTASKVDLTDLDSKRIKSEIDKLKSKL